MTKVVSPKGPDWFIIACCVVTTLALGAHSVSISTLIYSDPSLFWPFGILVFVMVMIIYLMCRVIAYEFCGKSDD